MYDSEEHCKNKVNNVKKKQNKKKHKKSWPSFGLSWVGHANLRIRT